MKSRIEAAPVRVSVAVRVRGSIPVAAFVLAGLLVHAFAAAQENYFPPRGDWETRSPEAAGFDPEALEDAVRFAVASESDAPRDLALNHELTFGREPHGELVGPTTVRGALSGIVVKDGYLVREWGPVRKVDMTFSVSKTFLSTVVGLLFDAGLIASVHDRVGDYMPDDELFGSEHNDSITWDHLLRQTSDWEGMLWGKPDWADRPVGDHPFEYPDRPMHEPGTFYKYNDVRVNLLALAALEVVREPLPVVLREAIMDPDRRLEPLALARLRELLGDDRRARDPVGQRRAGTGAAGWHISALDLAPLRLSVPPGRELGRRTADLRGMDRDGAHPRAR